MTNQGGKKRISWGNEENLTTEQNKEMKSKKKAEELREKAEEKVRLCRK